MIARPTVLAAISWVAFACVRGQSPRGDPPLQSACEPIPLDGSWRAHRTWRAELSLPAAVLTQDSVSQYGWIDDQPFDDPPGRYSISLFPASPERTFADSGTVRCPQRPGDRTQVAVLQHAGYPGIWFIAAWWPKEENLLLWGRSRDAWGARALATGMRNAVLLPFERKPR